MTSNRALLAMVLAPLVLFLVFGVVLAIHEGELLPIKLTALIGGGSSAMLLVLGGLMAGKPNREHAPNFTAMAAALGGSLHKNWIGEQQLQLHHPRGHIEIDYRVYSSDGDSREPYTRVALVMPGGSLPDERRDMLRNPGAEKKLGPATRAEVEALRGRVLLLGRGERPSVEVWVFGWLGAEEVVRLLERARPHLEALTERPWNT